jgi:IS1 family transposase/lambda repressor-like predicted transcriptional regulator
MNRLPIEKRAQIIGMLVEGMSMRAASRLAGVSINTITKLLSDVGAACSEYQDKTLRNLTITQVQCDEIWAFIGAKQKNVPADADPTLGLGDCYTYTAIDPITKLMPCYMLGYRTTESAEHFMADLASRLANRVQLTTDGMNGYPGAVAKAFGNNVDYAVLNKTYEGGLPAVEAKRRYSPAVCTGATKHALCGSPEMRDVSTSHVERANLTMRMGMRRFTRLTNAFSKKIEMHMHAVSLHFLHYNFARVHKTLKVTPAMQAGIADHVWTLEEIAALAAEPVAKKRGHYKPRAISN